MRLIIPMNTAKNTVKPMIFITFRPFKIITHYSGLMQHSNQTKLNPTNTMVGYRCLRPLFRMKKYRTSINSSAKMSSITVCRKECHNSPFHKRWDTVQSALYPLLNFVMTASTSILSTCTRSARYSKYPSLNSSNLPHRNHCLSPINSILSPFGLKGSGIATNQSDRQKSDG